MYIKLIDFKLPNKSKPEQILDSVSTKSKNPTIYNIIRWFAGLLGQMTRRPNIWWFFFYNFLQNSFMQKSFQLF